MAGYLFNIKLIIIFVSDCFLDFWFTVAWGGRISTTELVNRLFNFCEVYSGTIFYKYQEQMAKRYILSVLENDGEEITGLFSRQSGKTETIATVTGGLMIILPRLANMPMFLNDPRLEMFRDGFWVGIFAPSQHQAQITYNRMRGRMASAEAQAVLNDPDFRLSFDVANGTTVSLTNGSYCMAISASDNSNIEGETFKLLILEECFVKGTPVLTESGYKNIEDVRNGEKVYSFNHDTQEVELKTVVRSFSQPLYGRKMVTIRTESGKVLECTDNHRVYIKDVGYVRADALQIGDLMLSYRHTTQEKGGMSNETDDVRYNAGRRFNRVSRQEILEESEVYSVTHGKEVGLCDGEVRETERALQSRTKNREEQRTWRGFIALHDKVRADLERISRNVLRERKKSREVGYLEADGRGISSLLVYGRRLNVWDDVDSYASLHERGERNAPAMASRAVQGGLRDKTREAVESVLSILQRTSEKQISPFSLAICGAGYDVQDTSDGRRNTVRSLREDVCTVSQNKGQETDMLRRVQEEEQTGVFQTVLLEEQITEIEIREVEEVTVYDLTVEDNHNFFADSCLVHNCQDISNFKIRKSIHPMAAAYNGTIIKIGTPTTFKGDFYETIKRNKEREKRGGKKNHFEYNYKVVQKYNPKYAKYVEKEKERLGETSDEFRMSYNLEWIISRGMFVDVEELEKLCGEDYLERVPSDLRANHVAGVDIGGGSNGKNKKQADSTVVTVLEVDWDSPVLMDSSHDEETNQDIVYMAFNTYIKDWLELSPETAENYEEQYSILIEYFKRWRLAKVVIDATRESSLSQRIAANVNFEVVPFVFGVKSKSELYKHLQTEIKTGRARYPNGEETKATPEYKKFIEQMGDLQKGYRGADMVVSHPDEKGAHDDYSDSWALAVWGAKDKGYVDETETQSRNRVFRDTHYTSMNGNPYSSTNNILSTLTNRRNRITARRR